MLVKRPKPRQGGTGLTQTGLGKRKDTHHGEVVLILCVCSPYKNTCKSTPVLHVPTFAEISISLMRRLMEYLSREMWHEFSTENVIKRTLNYAQERHLNRGRNASFPRRKASALSLCGPENSAARKSSKI